MAIAIRSLSAPAVSTSNPYSVDKPAGLTVGDLMIFFVSIYNSGSPGAPAGFTLLDDAYISGPRVRSYFKVADAADVAAEAFTFANTTGASVWGVLYAVPNAEVEYHAAYGAEGPGITVTGFTPAATGDLLLVNVHPGYNGQTVHTENNNPSWTADASSSPKHSKSASYTTGATGHIGATDGWGVVSVVALSEVAGGGGDPETAAIMNLMRGMW